MDRSFIIPVAVAAGAHSLLFLSGDPTRQPPNLSAPIETILREYVLPPLDAEPIEPEPGSETRETKPPPPTTPDIPTVNFDPEKFTREVELRDMLPRPGAPDASAISGNWQDAVRAGIAPSPGVFDPSVLDNQPAARFQPTPVYPRDLRSLGTDGTATVTFSVDVHGSVFDASVTRCSHSSFGDEALRAVRRWRFEPGLKDGKRVPFRMVQTFSFSLAR